MTRSIQCWIGSYDYGPGGRNMLRALEFSPDEGNTVGLATITLRGVNAYVGDILDKAQVVAGEWDTTLNGGSGGYSWKWLQGTICARTQVQPPGTTLLDWQITVQDSNLALDRVGADVSNTLLRNTYDTLADQIGALLVAFESPAMTIPPWMLGYSVDSGLSAVLGSLPDLVTDDHSSLRAALDKLMQTVRDLYPGVSPRYYVGFDSSTASFGNPTLYVYNGVAGPAGGISLDVDNAGDVISVERLLDGTDKVEQRTLVAGGFTVGPYFSKNLLTARNPYAGDGYWWGTPVQGNTVVPFAVWQANAAHSEGDLVLPLTPNLRFFKCIVAGTSGSSEPAWPTAKNATVVDGGITWQEAGTTGATEGSLYTQLQAAIAKTSYDRETLRVVTPVRARIGYKVDFSWSKVGLSHVNYYVRQMRVTFYEAGKYEQYELVLGEKPLEYGATVDDDVPAVPVERDTVGPDAPGLSYVGSAYDAKNNTLLESYSWSRPVATDLAGYQQWLHYNGGDHPLPPLPLGALASTVALPPSTAYVYHLRGVDYAGNLGDEATDSRSSAAGGSKGLYNGSFALPKAGGSTQPDGWGFILSGAATAGTVAGGYDDATALQLYAPSAASFVATSTPFAVTARQVLSLQLAHRSASHLIAAATAALAVSFYDQSGSALGTTALGNVAPGSDVWQLAVYEKLVPPAGAVSAILTITSTVTSAAALQLDAIELLATAVGGQTAGAISAADQSKIDGLAGSYAPLLWRPLTFNDDVIIFDHDVIMFGG